MHRDPTNGATIAALLLMLAAIAGCGAAPEGEAKPGGEKTPGGAATEAKPDPTLPVRVAVVAGGTVAETLTAQGRLEACRREILAIKVKGYIAELPIEDNQQVKTGDTILRLQAAPDDIEAAARSTAKLDRAKRDLARREALLLRAPETVSASELDLARDTAADAQLEVDNNNLEERERLIKAPFAGVIISRAGTVGQSVVAGFQVAELQDISRFRLWLDLPEPSLVRLHLGQAVEIAALSDGTSTAGTIAAMPSAIDPAKGSGRVLVDVPAPPALWRPGGFVTARLLLGEVKAERVLPRDTVLYRQNKAFAWLVEEREGHLIARRAWLELGAGDALKVVVLSGLAAGDRVVTEGVSGLSDGIAVSLREADKTAVAAPDAPTGGKQP